jgi:hypothetical protein
VIRASQGDTADATHALRQAIGVRPDYALGWFNLGVLYGQRGPFFLLQSQGALGQAFRLDPALEKQPRSLLSDEHVYRTGLDLSKPLPAGWAIANAENRQPLLAVGLLGVLGATVALAHVSAGSGSSTSKVLESFQSTLLRIPGLRRRRSLWWGATATVAAFGLALFRSDAMGPYDAIAYLLAVSCLTGAVIVARLALAARWHVRLVQRSWPPGVVVGVIAGAVGTPWAPLPYVRGPARHPGVHLIAPTLLAATAAILLVESLTLHLPLTRAVGVAALTMAASMLLPLRPLDGAAVGKPGLLLGFGALAVAGLMVTGVL